MSKDAMQLALEALENSVDLVREDAYQAEKLYGNYPTRQGKVNGLKVLADDHEKAITALREALANEALDKMAENARELGLDYEPAQQEPVAGLLVGQDSDGRYVSIAAKAHADTLPLGEYKLYTSPPAQRTWVGLTDEEQTQVAWSCGAMSADWLDFAKAIEAKLKEKNT